VIAGRRRIAILVALGVSACGSVTSIGCAIVIVCSLALSSGFSVWFVVAGTLACAVTSLASFYAAFEGFDERLRRGP
jgi:hypothetical protein